MATIEQKQTTEHHLEKYMNKWQSLIKNRKHSAHFSSTYTKKQKTQEETRQNC